MEKAKTVDDYLARHPEWETALVRLRALILSTGLTETIKWGAPVYTLDNKNIVGIGAFKNYAGLWFFQGALLEDKKKILVNAGEGTAKAMRQLRFESEDEIDEVLVKRYVKEAIENQKQGKEIKPEKKKELVIPDELATAFSNDPQLRKSFDTLTPYKQREYADHIGGAKQEKTRLSRLEKSIPMIQKGIGLHDKYRDC